MRCLSLAEAWLASGQREVALVGAVTLAFVVDRARRLGVAMLTPGHGPDGTVLVVDSYDETVRRDAAVNGRYVRRVLVDDLGGAVPTGYDTVWNPNAYGDGSLYPSFAGDLLSGPEAVPLRTDLPTWRGAGTRRIGVALGGGSISSHLVVVLTRLGGRNANHCFAGVGDWVPAGWERFSSHDPWTGLSQCERLVIAAGTMTWEAARVGIPVVVVQTADNQERVADWAEAQGVPTLDLRHVSEEDGLAASLEEVLDKARPLPRIDSGSARVAHWLAASLDAARS